MRFRFSGHETFPCRYTWLPKTYAALCQNAQLFNDEHDAMVRLGVGKNMVRAIRFWVEVMGVAEPIEDEYRPTSFGHALFHPKGFDPYLEDVKTLWLLHWKMSSHVEEPLFAWYFLLNKWTEPDLSKSQVLKAFNEESLRQSRPLSTATLEQHFDMFLHTYMPTRGRKGEIVEDNLDCPLIELRLLTRTGERLVKDTDKREPVYSFRRDYKPEITGALLAYCLHDFWHLNRQSENTLSFREVALVPGSLGQVFKLSEMELRDRLDNIGSDSHNFFTYQTSAALPRVIKNFELKIDAEAILLANVYDRTVADYNVTQPQETQLIHA